MVTTAGVGAGAAGLAIQTVVAVVTAVNEPVPHTDNGATTETPVGVAVAELRD